ncbi:MAG: saccharopine dehydrogenase NADP-binding domain-containing protein [Acidimicrobiales bacterium]|nr:saccharopine dehydrogenase NADP-binding domain-containing protein [Acidimicrobiales bacterium]
MDDRTDRAHDLVVFGATSFVGQILCRYLVDRHGTDGPFRWAIAGRDAAKLDRVAAETGADVERIVVDAADAEGLAAMARSARVVVSTVGPYARYGSPLVAAVAAAGTDYCDLTGEPQWMRAMIDAHQDEAERTGARVVHACGFDSLPSDLGVWFTQQQALATLGAPCARIDMAVKAMRGGASGGTIASMLNLVEEAARDRDLRRQLADPYLLAPPDTAGPRQPDVTGPTRDEATGGWAGPFVMATVNTRVVHRSHGLRGRPWGPDFRYREVMATGPGVLGAAKAGALTAGIAVGAGAMAIGPLRRLAAERVLPKPGEGPSPEAQAAGSFDLRFLGTTATGDTVATQVTGDRDPGYGGTAKMLGEVATALADAGLDRSPGGFWTPSTAFGDADGPEALIERLEAHAGLRFTRR